MNETELIELDAWIAELMEPKPQPQPLRSVRQKNDHLYNCSERTSFLGWWRCEAGLDAEDERGAETPCVWVPKFTPCQNPDESENSYAAMEVLSKCTEKLGVFEHISINHAEGEFAIRVAHAGWDWIWAETLPLAICRFAKKLFS